MICQNFTYMQILAYMWECILLCKGCWQMECQAEFHIHMIQFWVFILGGGVTFLPIIWKLKLYILCYKSGKWRHVNLNKTHTAKFEATNLCSLLLYGFQNNGLFNKGMCCCLVVFSYSLLIFNSNKCVPKSTQP